MAQKYTLVNAEPDEKSGKTPEDTPPRKRAPRLGNVHECRREIQKVYGDARTGRLPASEAGRLVWIVQTLVGVIRDTELEDRLRALEERQDR